MKYTYVERSHPLYISSVSSEYEKQDQHQETLEATGDKGQ